MTDLPAAASLMAPRTPDVMRLWRRGIDTHDIAAMLGVSEATVYNALALHRGHDTEPGRSRSGK